MRVKSFGECMINIAEKLRELRKVKKVTQQNVADHLEMKLRSYQYYKQNYETGGHRPDYETLVKLADYFDVTTDYLLGRSEERN